MRTSIRLAALVLLLVLAETSVGAVIGDDYNTRAGKRSLNVTNKRKKNNKPKTKTRKKTKKTKMPPLVGKKDKSSKKHSKKNKARKSSKCEKNCTDITPVECPKPDNTPCPEVFVPVRCEKFRLECDYDNQCFATAAGFPEKDCVKQCVPTTGSCVSTFADLQSAVSQAGPNDVVAIYGNGESITMETAITVDQHGITLCCSGPDPCILQSSGVDRNLLVIGENFTLSGILFLSGNIETLDFNSGGGNVAIEAPGDHHVQGCEFRHGRSSRYGGNLFVSTNGSLIIQRSRFVGGYGSYGGGGLAVWDALQLSIKDSVFQDNIALSNGGGMFTTGIYQGTGQDISLYKTSFVNNTARYGGGFLATTIGTLPSLDIQLCTFNSNSAYDGGAAAILHYHPTLNLTLRGNGGTGNFAENECSDLFFYIDVEMICIGVAERFSDILAGGKIP